jgi:predicted aldo/keto reductase-like oxidoreductase
MDRREFLEKSFQVGAGLSVFPLLRCRGKKTTIDYKLPRQKLGQTGEMLSIIGFGGILLKDEEQAAANTMVKQAFDRGINYFDVAPTYGNAEERLGPALKPFRDRCFLACKTTQRDKVGAERELHESLRILQTEHFDLYQLHAITTQEDVEKALGPNGAMEVFFKAKQEGKIRFIGFSAHSEDAALLAMDKYDFDTVLFPINFVCLYQGNFGPRVVTRAKEKKMGILAIKALAFTRIQEGEENPYKKLWYKPIEDEEMSNLALRFTLSQGVTSAIPPGEARFFWKAVEIAEEYTPLTTQENDKLRKLAEGVEPLFKTS